MQSMEGGAALADRAAAAQPALAQPQQPGRQPPQHRRALRPRQRPLRADARRDHGVFLRRLRAGRRDPARGAAREVRAHLPQAAAGARRPPARDRHRLGRVRDPRRQPLRLPRHHHHDLARAARLGAARRSRRPACRTASRCCSTTTATCAGRYDKLVSIEMIEAVGARYLDTYSAQCARLLEPHGAMLLQAITIQDQLLRGGARVGRLHPALHLPGQLHPVGHGHHRLGAPRHAT